MNQINLDTSIIGNLTESFEQGHYQKSLYESLNFLDKHKCTSHEKQINNDKFAALDL